MKAFTNEKDDRMGVTLCACVCNNGGILAKKKVKSEQNDLEAFSKIAKLELLMFIQMACRPNNNLHSL